MAGGIEVVFAPDFFFQLADLRREELDGDSAIRADHVMVAAAVELVFVAGHAVVKSNLAGQAALSQKLERTINRSKPDLGVLLSDQAEKLVGGKMIAGFQEGAQDGIALLGVLQAYALQVLEEDVLRFTHGFARRRSMIVNPSLQHVGSQFRGSCLALATEDQSFSLDK